MCSDVVGVSLAVVLALLAARWHLQRLVTPARVVKVQTCYNIYVTPHGFIMHARAYASVCYINEFHDHVSHDVTRGAFAFMNHDACHDPPSRSVCNSR